MGATVGELPAGSVGAAPVVAVRDVAVRDVVARGGVARGGVVRAERGSRLVRVVVAEENAVLRYGLLALLASAPEVEVVAEAGGVVEATMLTRVLAPDVLLLGVRGGDLGLDMVPLVQSATNVIILADADDPSAVVTAVTAGASSYLVYGQVEQSQIVEAVRGAASGLSFLSPSAAAALVGRVREGQEVAAPRETLTPREREVMELIAGGLTNQEIAARLVISGKTVKNHVHHVYKRLKVDNRDQAIVRWRQLCAGPRLGGTDGVTGAAHRSEHC